MLYSLVGLDAKWTLKAGFTPGQEENKKPAIPCGTTGFRGAAGRIRTADLILTKDALYRLSYSSEFGDPERARTVDL